MSPTMPECSVPQYWVQKRWRSEEHTSELQSQFHLVCRLLLEKKKKKKKKTNRQTSSNSKLSHAKNISYIILDSACRLLSLIRCLAVTEGRCCSLNSCDSSRPG